MSTDVMLRDAPAPEISDKREFVTVERYFEISAESHTRVEYLDGELFYMSGVRYAHGKIQSQLAWLLVGHLDDNEYDVLSSNVCIRARQLAYFFPDLTVVRGKPRFAPGRNDLLNPVLVVEVLSPSTRNHDLDNKLPVYRAMPSLEHILIVEQNHPSVVQHRRAGDAWVQHQYSELHEIVTLDSLGASLSLAQIYRGIDFSQS